VKGKSIRHLVPDPPSAAGEMRIAINCACGLLHEFNVMCQDVLEWKAGRNVKLAFPYITAEQRELLISQLCNQCFERLKAKRSVSSPRDDEEWNDDNNID
jgi:hypothetical protein